MRDKILDIETISQKVVYDMLCEKKLESWDDLSFCLTVIRDNCMCDNTWKYLDLLINLWCGF